MTISALACGGAALLLGCLIPLLRPRSLDSVAAQVDRAHPSLQERCQTITEFAQSKDQPEIRGSEGMIRKVAQQTAAMSGSVVPAAVVSKQGLICAAKFFGAAAAVLALFFLVDFPARQSPLPAVSSAGRGHHPHPLAVQDRRSGGRQGRKCDPGIHRHREGDPIRPDFPSIPPRAAMKSWSWTRTPRSPPPARPSSSIPPTPSPPPLPTAPVPATARPPVHHVTVLERPSLAQVQFRIEAPAYSQLPLVNEKSLPRQVRALEGSKLEISFLPDQELASLDLKFSDGTSQRLEKSAGPALPLRHRPEQHHRLRTRPHQPPSSGQPVPARLPDHRLSGPAPHRQHHLPQRRDHRPAG